MRFIKRPTRTFYSTDSSYSPSLIEAVHKKTRRTVINSQYSRRGRPVGTYDRRYAVYGGVYGYRKAMALERFKQRQEILNRLAVNPQQRQVLANFEARRRMAMINPENQQIPDTDGNTDAGSYFDEINRAANLVD
jgi:hypothetical protein